MKRTLVLLGTATLVFAFLICFVSIAKSDEATSESAGQKLFVAKKCNTCHSIESQKVTKKLASSKAPDLSDLGKDHDAEWITKWLNKEVDLDGKKHSSSWTGTPEDEKTLADWLATLKKEAK